MTHASSNNGTTTQLGVEWLFHALANVDITRMPVQPVVATNAVVNGQGPIAAT